MLNQKTLIFVSTEVVSRTALANQFRLIKNFICFEFEDIDTAVSYSQKNRTTVILIDADFPKVESSKLFKNLQTKGIHAPAVFLTNSSSHPENVIIDASAKVAYSIATKPFRFVQLSAHVKTIIGRFEQTDAASLPLAHFSFHPALKTLTDINQPVIQLTDKESDILEFLLFSKDNTATRELMLEHVWGYNPEADTHTIDTHVYKLRQKMESDPNNPKLLVSYNGGFRLNA